jgi:hypothetical protein
VVVVAFAGEFEQFEVVVSSFVAAVAEVVAVVAEDVEDSVVVADKLAVLELEPFAVLGPGPLVDLELEQPPELELVSVSMSGMIVCGGWAAAVVIMGGGGKFSVYDAFGLYCL